ncbi:MAG: hypothetical protein HXX10_28835 [Rhodoplanes sp.]|uniref:hypothetical protein n=1 Tax=Rhodoplanes sp. TaxID=1968906 RepID=UPI0017B518D0|nr:hypothetical protein [Rhodoplanes sp.]NVO18045.1 hypothetical protein [Rhodoplanes sp.]
MMNSGCIEEWGSDRTLFGKQHCPRCSYLLVAPDESHHVADRVVRHMWSCEACGTGFSTWVKFQPERGEMHCAEAA